MIPFTPQQVRFLREIGDGTVFVDLRPSTTLYLVNGRLIKGRGLTATFNGLMLRCAVVHLGNFRYRVTDEAKAQLHEQVTTMAVCPGCGRQRRTQPNDNGVRFFNYHKHGRFACSGWNREAIFDEAPNA